MGVKRRQHTSAFKAKVALEAAKQQKTIAQLASEFGVHATMITKWKRRLLQGLPDLFLNKPKKKERDTEKLIEVLYQQIGQLKVESDWLKKKSELLCR